MSIRRATFAYCEACKRTTAHTKRGCAVCRAKAKRAERKQLRAAPIQRKSRPPKVRKTTLAALKRKLWKLFALYVKERDGNVCFSCGRESLVGSGWHAGHLFPAGSHNVIRLEPKNVHSQCYFCNINLGGNGAAYTARFLDRYGIDEFRRLDALSRRLKQWRSPEIEELIAALKRGGADYEILYAEKYGLSVEIHGAKETEALTCDGEPTKKP